MSRAGSGRGHRAGRDQPALSGVDDRVEALERSRAEQRQVTCLAENDLVDGLELAALDQGGADVAGDVLAFAITNSWSRLNTSTPAARSSDSGSQVISEPVSTGTRRNAFQRRRRPGFATRTSTLNTPTPGLYEPACCVNHRSRDDDLSVVFRTAL